MKLSKFVGEIGIVNKFCTKCGTETEDDGDLHCRKILIEKVKKILSSGELECAKSLVENTCFNEGWEKWKWEMFERLSFDLRNEMAHLKEEQEHRQRQAVKKRIEDQLAPFLQQAERFIACGQFREAEIYVLDNQMIYPTLPLLRKYKTDLRQRIPETHRIPIYYTPRTDWQFFEDLRTRQKLSWLVHITDEQNLDSIKHYRGIFSRQAMNDYGIRPCRFASNKLSRELDRQKDLFDYIHLSIQRSPMMYISNINPVALLIDSRFIFAQETKFSDKNSVDSNAIIGSSFEDFARINFRVVRGRWSTENEKKLFQAEILVKHYIPIEFIRFS